jgi:hypothetical protein
MSDTTEKGGGPGLLTPPASRRAPTSRGPRARRRGHAAPPRQNARPADRTTIAEEDRYERRRLRMDPWVRNEIEVLVSIVIVIVASGFAAYFYGIWMYGPA